MKRRPRAVSVAPWSLRALALTPLAWALACDAEPSAADQAPAVTDACGRYGAVIADFRRTCLGFSYEPEVGVAPRAEAACRSVLALDGTGATEAAFDACAAALPSAYCSANVYGAPLEALGDRLAALVSACRPSGGARAPGQPCVSSWQCASGICSAPDAPCGVCVAAAEIGEPCGASPCRLDARCDFATSTCVAASAAGAPCGAGCAEGTYCRGEVCQPFPQLGEPCSGPCGGWSRCSQDTGRCTRLGVAGEGERCGDGDVAAACGPGLDCEQNRGFCVRATFVAPGGSCDRDFTECIVGDCRSDGQTGAWCPAVIAEGVACDPADLGAICDVGTSCVDGTCQRPESIACE